MDCPKCNSELEAKMVGQPEVEIDTANPALNGMNNVDIDQEMANLAKNTLDYNTAATLLRHEYTRFRLSMGGGGGAR